MNNNPKTILFDFDYTLADSSFRTTETNRRSGIFNRIQTILPELIEKLRICPYITTEVGAKFTLTI